MNTQIFETNDGSHSIISTQFGEAYHSRHGAIQESMHVFIGHALQYKAHRQNIVKILEMGFGTGLNAWLSLLFAQTQNIHIAYHTIEQYPLPIQTLQNLNFTTLTQNIFQTKNEDTTTNQTTIQAQQIFLNMHQTDWQNPHQITPNFELTKYNINITHFESPHLFDIIYYDAFAPNAQPELWTQEIFTKMYQLLEPNGILTTYCAKGEVRRNLQKAGFDTEKLPGPPGKREMLRAQKLMNK